MTGHTAAMTDTAATASRTLPAKVTVLSGGVGGARFIQGVLRHVERTGSATVVTVVANTGTASAPLPSGEVLLASGPLAADGTELPADTTVWLAS